MTLKSFSERLSATTIIYHDDPLDNETLSVLRAWALREGRVRLILSDMGSRGERIQRLTLCRNVLLAEAATRINVKAKGAGFVVQLDLDCQHSSPSAMLSAIELQRSGSMHFDVLTSNSPGAYRDMWALRSTALGMDYDCFWDFRMMQTRGNCKKHRIFVNPSAEPFKIEAGFNGLAIYAASTLVSGTPARRCRYANETATTGNRKKHVVSEHVPFQRCLGAAGLRIGLVPSLQTYCHDWQTRHDAMRTFYLRNGTVVRLMHRATRPHPEWLQRRA